MAALCPAGPGVSVTTSHGPASVGAGARFSSVIGARAQSRSQYPDGVKLFSEFSNFYYILTSDVPCLTVRTK